jgi:hypothetical protein
LGGPPEPLAGAEPPPDPALPGEGAERDPPPPSEPPLRPELPVLPEFPLGAGALRSGFPVLPVDEPDVPGAKTLRAPPEGLAGARGAAGALGSLTPLGSPRCGVTMPLPVTGALVTVPGAVGASPRRNPDCGADGRSPIVLLEGGLSPEAAGAAIFPEPPVCSEGLFT